MLHRHFDLEDDEVVLWSHAHPDTWIEFRGSKVQLYMSSSIVKKSTLNSKVVPRILAFKDGIWKVVEVMETSTEIPSFDLSQVETYLSINNLSDKFGIAVRLDQS